MQITGVVTNIRTFDEKMGRDGKPMPSAHAVQVEGLNVLVYGEIDPSIVNQVVSVTVQANYDRETKRNNIRALGMPRLVTNGL